MICTFLQDVFCLVHIYVRYKYLTETALFY